VSQWLVIFLNLEEWADKVVILDMAVTLTEMSADIVAFQARMVVTPVRFVKPADFPAFQVRKEEKSADIAAFLAHKEVKQSVFQARMAVKQSVTLAHKEEKPSVTSEA
jgi:hypothetical protein